MQNKKSTLSLEIMFALARHFHFLNLAGNRARTRCADLGDKTDFLKIFCSEILFCLIFN